MTEVSEETLCDHNSDDFKVIMVKAMDERACICSIVSRGKITSGIYTSLISLTQEDPISDPKERDITLRESKKDLPY